MTSSASVPRDSELRGDAPVPQPAMHSVDAPALPAESMNNTIAPSKPDALFDAEPVAEMVAPTETASGISGVAQFLPADANLKHATPQPSESLATVGSTVDHDASMIDPPTELMQVAEAGSAAAIAEDVKPVMNGEAALMPTPQYGSVLLAETASEKVPQIASPGLEVAAEPSAPAPPAPEVPAASVDTFEGNAVAEPPATQYLVDQPMLDAPGASLTRSREDDEGTEERSAKRSKVEDTGDAPADFKLPDLPAAPAPAPAPAIAPVTNGVSSHLPPAPSFSTGPLTAGQKSMLTDKLKNTKKIKSAIAFLTPVDYVAMGIPNYPSIISHPMDLSTMERKLKNDEYRSLDDFVADFELIVNNCFTFNGPGHVVSINAQNLRAYFLKQMAMVPRESAGAPKAVKKAPPPPAKSAAPARRESRQSIGPAKSPADKETFALRPEGTPQIRRESSAGRPKRPVVPPAPRDLPYSTTKPKRKENQVGLKFCDTILAELRRPKHDRYTFAFRDPVDPVALNIPNYFSLIKQPMDMSTATNKLKTGQYSTAEEFKSDFDLMLNNCFRFNPSDNAVHLLGKEFQREFERLWKGKDSWVKHHQPHSRHVSSASDVASEEDESEEDEEAAEHNSNEATIQMLREQLANMQNMVASISSAQQAPSKAPSKKKSKSSSGVKSKKSSSVPSAPARSAAKAKPKKQRLVTYEEKQEISTATEHMTAGQVEKLTNIITENVSKYKDMSESDVELEIDDLPNEVQHKLLRYVRTLFPKQRASPDDLSPVDDDYEPERNARGGAAKKKHKPMKKHEQESRIAQLKQTMAQMKGNGVSAGGGDSLPAQAAESSGDEDSESSEEE